MSTDNQTFQLLPGEKVQFAVAWPGPELDDCEVIEQTGDQVRIKAQTYGKGDFNEYTVALKSIYWGPTSDTARRFQRWKVATGEGVTVTNLQDLIAQCIAAKHGNREFLLTWDGEVWIAALGNTSAHVALGEAIAYGDKEADFIVTAGDPVATMQALLTKLLVGQQ